MRHAMEVLGRVSSGYEKLCQISLTDKSVVSYYIRAAS